MNRHCHLHLTADATRWGIALAASLVVLWIAWSGWVPDRGPAAGEILALPIIGGLLCWFAHHIVMWICESVTTRVLASIVPLLMGTNVVLWIASLYFFVTQHTALAS